MHTVQVSLGNRSYPIRVGSGLLSKLGQECARLDLGRRCAVITDTNVGPLFSEGVLTSLGDAGFEAVLITVPSGERSKALSTAARCYDQLAGHRLERKSFIIALGGGVVGDLAGFVAATYLRGLPLVQVPTTLLAQVDSSVGGKVGVNLRAGKNLVGAFHQPRIVLCDPAAFASLPQREFRAGLAEVIKYGIIYDAALFRRLERDLDRILAREESMLAPVIARCLSIKAEVVGQDETETGLRAILNFGHTIGHGLEAISFYGRYLHGEAISIGQVAASHLSVRTGFSPAEIVRVRDLFTRAGLPVSVKLDAKQRTRLFAAMRLDKKMSGGAVRFVLAHRLGKAGWGQEVPDADVHTALDAVSE